MTLTNLTDLANESGGILYIMLVLLLVALTVIIERTRYLAAMEKGGEKLISLVKKERNRVEDLELPKKSATLPHASLFAVLKNNQTCSSAVLEGHLEEVIMQKVPKLDRSLWVLDTVITLAPLLGLFGTIVGMFNAFHVLGDAQNGSAQVTGGIAEALISTACGLLIAMIGLIFFNALHNKVRLVIHQMETLKIMILNRHAENELTGVVPAEPESNHRAQVELLRTSARA